MKANEARWEHCTINLGIYASFVLDTCERVTQNRVDGKTETEALGRLVTAAAVRDHWRAQADLLKNALPELDLPAGHRRTAGNHKVVSGRPENQRHCALRETGNG